MITSTPIHNLESYPALMALSADDRLFMLGFVLDRAGEFVRGEGCPRPSPEEHSAARFRLDTPLVRWVSNQIGGDAKGVVREAVAYLQEVHALPRRA